MYIWINIYTYMYIHTYVYVHVHAFKLRLVCVCVDREQLFWKLRKSYEFNNKFHVHSRV